MTPNAVRRRIFLNSLANAVGSILPIPVMLVLIPHILHHVGPEGYGVWGLIGAIVGTAQLADFGVSGAVTRNVAYHAAADDRHRMVEVVHSATVIFGLIALLLSGAAAALWPLLERVLFAAAPLPASELRWLFLASIGVFALTVAISAFSALLDGLQRLGIQNAIRIGSLVGSTLVIYVGVAQGYGLWALVGGSAAALVVRIVSLLVLVPYLFPPAVRRPFRASRTRLRELTGFSSQISVVQISGFAYYQLPKLYLGVLASLASVGLYEIAATQMQRFQNLVTGLVYPFLPALAETSARTDAAGVAEGAALYRLAHRFLAALVLPFLSGLVIFAGPFVRLWLGPAYVDLAPALVWVGIGTVALILTAPAHYLLIGYGAMRADVERALLGIALSVVGVYVGARSGGLVGATVANAGAALAAVLWLTVRSGRIPVVRVSGRAVSMDYGRMLLACIPSAAVALSLVRVMPPTWGGFLASAGAFVLAVVASAFAVRFVTVGDFRALRRMLATRNVAGPLQQGPADLVVK